MSGIGQTQGRASASLRLETAAVARRREDGMASIRKIFEVAASAEQVWDALRDFNAVDRRVAPGFVTGVAPEDGARLVTFANGATAREVLVDCDDQRRRLVYAVVGGRPLAHSASVEVTPLDDGACQVTWITDVLPNDLRDLIDMQMSAAVPIMTATLGRIGKA
jgi:hypothetical protein